MNNWVLSALKTKYVYMYDIVMKAEIIDWLMDLPIKTIKIHQNLFWVV